MSKDKIELWAPWKWEEMNSIFPGQEPQGTTIMSSGGHYVCHQFNIRPIAQRQELATAIVSAVNNTYGTSINPEGVPNLLAALEGMLEPFSHIGGVGREAKFKAMQAAKAAIEKAKL